ncbi:membrane protein [Alkalihalobacillus alcalophilus ATCC 27647 = CGMCC 1.3604]|uniref:Membrane protein n=1 Tax=Alkalihalobacillus alcalophilus ATCC 27647 = CGMCC 1.3604 TaxID=1218173 RepID=A0A094WNM2_ALKAL|nr:multidrug resistance efflux transporter family protein [Alkalihalobacillus alcalophilus]KGA98446.1 membrane protein [Alkalihalobacillus alcalophilus ATCC 27647 = CGMCC 1.3604]MED1563328.1 multidrug resistance efflux transporter family protein [Alkalihalobacillus alcalophilus]THG88516.1 membrane protein [Alkalihalobacillus alcalophilus ATCC 27647 = CGMCC 1.3604]
MKAIVIGIIASIFFSSTFIINRSIDLEGGSWYYSASLRFLFMIPFLVLIVSLRGGLGPLFAELKKAPIYWLIWSFVGFVLFYAPITYAAAYGPGWLIAGTWQMTIVAGLLLSPLFFMTIEKGGEQLKVRQRIPLKALWPSLIILFGVLMIQLQQSEAITLQLFLLSVIPVTIAAFAYPLGNRKMMEKCQGRLDSFQRVLGMTIASLPWWLLLFSYGFVVEGPPPSHQVLQTFLVALFAGVIATVLFFWATDLVRGDAENLAAVEATQSGAVLFALIGEIILLSGKLPSFGALIGLGCIMAGMIIHSYVTTRNKKPIQKSLPRAN